LNVEPPPANVLGLAESILILPVPVPAVVVKLVGCALLNDVPDPLMASVPPLNVRFFVPAAVVYVPVVPIVSVRPLRSIVPLVCVSVLVAPSVRSFVTSCHVPPIPLNVTGKSKVLPPEFIVFVPLVDPNVVVATPPARVIELPDGIVKLP